MAIRPIELLGSPALREVAREVDSFDDELAALVRDMFETMYHADGIGLAGPQVGVPLRVTVLDVREGQDEEGVKLALVNPRVVENGRAKDRAPEGCLSIPGIEGVVERPSEVVVEAFDPGGDPVRVEASGLLARARQHEIDHLDGILFIDRVSPLKREILLKKWRKSQAEASVS